MCSGIVTIAVIAALDINARTDFLFMLSPRGINLLLSFFAAHRPYTSASCAHSQFSEQSVWKFRQYPNDRVCRYDESVR